MDFAKVLLREFALSAGVPHRVTVCESTAAETKAEARRIETQWHWKDLVSMRAERTPEGLLAIHMVFVIPENCESRFLEAEAKRLAEVSA